MLILERKRKFEESQAKNNNNNNKLSLQSKGTHSFLSCYKQERFSVMHIQEILGRFLFSKK